MTEPGVIPAYQSMPWSAYCCTVRGCLAPPVTVDLINGKRCHGHPPRFSADVAVRLLMAGWPATARAYMRSFPEQAAA